ncbi:MAG TPA: hypothetical protein VII63_00075 [Caulobacteraceae bacterium]
MKVSEINATALDAAGIRIEEVYAKYDPVYAVYRTAERVLVHFSDDADQEKTQRTALASLSPIRGEINGLIDGWRTSKKPQLYSRSRRFERRVADALVVALEGDMADAILVLQAVKIDLMDERVSIGRFQYLKFASATACATLLAIIVLHGLLGAIFNAKYSDDDKLILFSAAVGAVGAFFSIAIAIRNRSVQTDLHARDNAADAILRILIGVIAAPVLIALLRSNAVSMKIGNTELQAVTIATWGPTVMVSFLAGFMERLVGDLLTKSGAGLGVRPASPSETMTGAKQPPPGAAGAADPGAKAAAGAAAPDPDAPDGCTSGQAPDVKAATDDGDLPATTGGQA